MTKLKVAVLFGGRSNEHEISLQSATYVIKNLIRNKFEVLPIGISKTGEWFFYSGMVDDIGSGKWILNKNRCVRVVFSSDPKHRGFLIFEGSSKFLLMKVDCVFLVLHGKNGEDGRLQGFFEAAKMPFVGCGSVSSANCMDKEITHIILEHEGIKTTKFSTIHKNNTHKLEKFCKKIKSNFEFPVFVKPANAGSSIGISKCSEKVDLKNAILKAFEVDDKVICEQAVRNCKEIECAVLGNKVVKVADCLGEIKSCNDFYDYDAKYKMKSELIVPANLSDDVAKQVKQIAEKAFKAMGCKGMARIDFLIGENNDIFLNEINTIPGFTEISMYSKLWLESGLSGPDLMFELVNLALEI